MTDTPPYSRPTGRQANGRFGPGNAGRPLGSRNRISHTAMLSIIADFEAGKRELIDRLYAALAAHEGR